jgi:hypothetical protein
MHEGKLPAPQALSSTRRFVAAQRMQKPPSIGFDGRRFHFVRTFCVMRMRLIRDCVRFTHRTALPAMADVIATAASDR